MKWRKLNRIVHRDLGYLFFGMSIIYAVSGIVLNHARPGGDASIVSRSEAFQYKAVVKEEFDAGFVRDIIQKVNIPVSEYKSFYFPNNTKALIYLRNGHIQYNLKTGEGAIVTIKKRPVLTAFNFLHYNKPKKLWTWFSDAYAVSLILVSISGLFILRGKKGITGRGAVLTLAGIIIPVIFLFIYFWSA